MDRYLSVPEDLVYTLRGTVQERLDQIQHTRRVEGSHHDHHEERTLQGIVIVLNNIMATRPMTKDQGPK